LGAVLAAPMCSTFAAGAVVDPLIEEVAYDEAEERADDAGETDAGVLDIVEEVGRAAD
jgi:hypothetical protein